MANGGEEKWKSDDLYQVLGLNKECTATELRSAYKKLALRWHPDRCSASGNSKFVEEAKKKFQAIQQAYSVLSDANKRFLYDVGVYDSDDDENGCVQGMGDFLNEMAVMMSQTKPSENMEESLEELQELFDEMFQEDLHSIGIDSQAAPSCSPYVSYSESSNSNNKRVSSDMNLGKTKVDDSSSFNSHFEKFCLGTGGTAATFQEGEGGSKRRNSRRSQRQKKARQETKSFFGL
ncbi:PREDICTED: chaperone protein dnaJ 6-like isoform X3 [Populus euphratica]|uniref:Chaperone protein dnaJ 6-like isoform X3 n=1 Tax=Populus euphratica TaxID=75702 RepID=A0AAJ6UVZ6_POPEU|nr:PREDICTED: chaperone protein dnaJ 6-like isoform X3 [Populus euphratica]